MGLHSVKYRCRLCQPFGSQAQHIFVDVPETDSRLSASLFEKKKKYIYMFFFFSKGGYLEVNHSNIQLFTNCSNFLLFVRFLLLDLIQFDRIMSYDSKLSSNQPLPHPRFRHFDRMPPSLVPSYLYNYIATIMLHLSVGVDSFSSAELLVFNSS